MLDDVAVIMDDDDLLPEEFGEHGWRFAVAKKNLRRANASATERATAWRRERRAESERRSQQTVPANADEGVSQPAHRYSRSNSRSVATGVGSRDSSQRESSRFRSRSRGQRNGTSSKGQAKSRSRDYRRSQSRGPSHSRSLSRDPHGTVRFHGSPPQPEMQGGAWADLVRSGGGEKVTGGRCAAA
ncbi:hypothetical protein MRX96_010787 [Rhipicephalus microplus]